MRKPHPIRAFRKAAGLTQKQFAKRAKIPQPHLSLIETGKRKNLTGAVIGRLIKASGGKLTFSNITNTRG